LAVVVAGIGLHFIVSSYFALRLANYLRDIGADDTFYYLEIARNLASGHFSTFDGVTRTNGHHPLWTALLVVVQWIARDPVRAVGLSKALEFALLVASALALLWAGRRARSFALLWCWPLAQFFAEPNLYLGMEAALHLFMLSAALAVLAEYHESSRRIWLVALCLALVPWARLESAAFSFTVAALELARARLSRRPLGPATTMLVAVSASVLGYFLLSDLLFHTPVPVSGQLKNLYSQIRWASEGGEPALGARFRAQLQIEFVSRGVIWSMVGIGLVVISFANRSLRQRATSGDRAFDVVVVGLAATHLARVAFSALFVHPGYSAYGWYYVPALLLQAICPPLFVHRALRLLDVLPTQTQGALKWAGALGLVFFVAPENPYARRNEWLASHEIDWERASYSGAEWMNANLPAGAVVGSEDAGVIGYFTNQRVVNLDGLAESKEFADQLAQRHETQLLVSYGISHIANVMRLDHGCDVFVKLHDPNMPAIELTPIYEGVHTTDGARAFRLCRVGAPSR
jgi:hypothetical protein